MEQSTYAAALVPWVHSLGVLIANLGVILLVVLMAMFCGAAMVGSKRKQERRIGSLRPKKASGAPLRSAVRILIRPLVRRIELRKFQREVKGGDGWSI